MADWKCSRCEWVNRDWVKECISCGAGRDDVAQHVAVTEPAPAAGATVVTPAPDGSVGTFESEAAAPLGGSGLIGGLAAGAVAAVLATAVWYAVVVVTEYEIGFVAILVGWLVGTAVVYGSRRRVSIPLVAASGILTLVALSVSEYLIVYHVLTQELGLPLGLLEVPELIIELALESIRTDPITLLFWALALFQAVYVPFRVMRPSGTPVTPNYELRSRAS